MQKITSLAVMAFLVSSTASFAQKKHTIDTTLNMGIYKTYFNYKAKNPLYITYTLQNGGGDCDRKKEGFKFYTEEYQAASAILKIAIVILLKR